MASGAGQAGNGRHSARRPLLDSSDSVGAVAFDAETGLAVPPSAIWMVFLIVFMDVMGGQISTPAMPYYAKAFGVDNAAVGLLFAGFQLTGIFGAPALGRLSDKFGRRGILLLSLLGAGVAGLGQAFAPSFAVLFAFRSFGGVWGAVMPSAKVYIADVCSPEVLPDYMAYLSSIPGAAQTFGPGLGGGLTKIGLSVPVLADGTLSLVILALVFFYLPESPAWLAGKREAAAGRSRGDQRPAPGAAAATTPTPWGAHALGLSSFFFSLGMYSSNSMLPIVLSAKLDWDALHVGYCLTVVAIFRLAASIWVAVPVQKRLGKRNAAGLGSFLTGLFLIVPAFVDTAWLIVVLLSVSRAASSIRNAVVGSLGAALTDKTNRGRIFSLLECYQNVGRLLGPVAAGQLAMYDAAAYPLIFSGSALAVSGLLDVSLRTGGGRPAERPAAESEWEQGDAVLEIGTQRDCDELGRFVAGLLKQRRYRWISHDAEVRTLLDIVLPELCAPPDQQVEELQRLIRHARLMRVAFDREADTGQEVVPFARESSAPAIQLALPASLCADRDDLEGGAAAL